MPKVHIVGNPWQYRQMFEKYQWEVVDEPALADLIQFTGGEDVSPELYGEDLHSTTRHNPQRDRREAALFRTAYGWEIPMAGICRGGQFLNVMCGGRMFQDVDNHSNGPHEAWCNVNQKSIRVTSTHHQMMRPNRSIKHLVTLSSSVSRKRSTRPKGRNETTVYYKQNTLDDVEAIYYPNQKVFCFQPHPEYNEQEELSAYYMWSLWKYLLTEKRN